MSKPLNGCVRSHASKPSSSSFNPASRFAETHYTSLGLLVAAIASNDLDRLASQETNIDQTLQNLASALNVLADYRLQQVDRLSEKNSESCPMGYWLRAKTFRPCCTCLRALPRFARRRSLRARMHAISRNTEG